jgi:hypothetical protein
VNAQIEHTNAVITESAKLGSRGGKDYTKLVAISKGR